MGSVEGEFQYALSGVRYVRREGGGYIWSYRWKGMWVWYFICGRDLSTRKLDLVEKLIITVDFLVSKNSDDS